MEYKGKSYRPVELYKSMTLMSLIYNFRSDIKLVKKKNLTILLTIFTIIGTILFPQTKVNAAITNGWEQSGTTWNYYINGNKTTGWISSNSHWYFLNSSGTMETGWASNNGNWYYLNSSGDMATGWKYLNNKWYYLESSGAMSTGWISNNSNWYYLKSSGDMDTGWVLNNSQWYYLKSSGAMATGWVLDNNTWYYLNSNGSMKTGWITTNSKSYYLNANGAMAVNTKTPDGYVVGNDGAWDGKPQIITPKVIKTTSVSLNKTTSSLIVGETDTLLATVNPSDATNKSVTWKSSNDSILTVDANGTVTAINAGTAIITVTTVDGSKTASCTFTVNPIKIVSIDDITVNIIQNDIYNLPTTVVANMNTGKTLETKVLWKSAVVDTSKLGTSTFEGTVDGYDKVVKLTLNVNKYEPNLHIYNYSSITINNICKDLSINVNNNGDKSVTINKIEVYEKGNLVTTYNKSDLISSNISADVLPHQTFGISISYKLGIYLDNSYVKYYIESNGDSFEYKVDIKQPTY